MEIIYDIYYRRSEESVRDKNNPRSKDSRYFSFLLHGIVFQQYN